MAETDDMTSRPDRTTLAADALGALMLNEPVEPTFVIGGTIVLAGVYIGAVHRSPRPAPPAPATPVVARNP